MYRLLTVVLFAIGMIATTSANAQFIDGQLYYGSQAVQLEPRLQSAGLDPNGIYVYRMGTNMLEKYCPTCPPAPVAPQPYVQPMQPIQPYYPPAPAPAPTTTYVVVETQRDGAAKFRDVGVGFGALGMGAGSVMTGVAGLQGKLGTNVYTNTNVFGGGGRGYDGGGVGGVIDYSNPNNIPGTPIIQQPGGAGGDGGGVGLQGRPRSW